MSENSLDLDTPIVSVDLAIVDNNIKRLQKLADQCHMKVRPHIKTHKSATFARAQLDAGAVGVTAAKLGEAEVMAKAGIMDILIAYPIIGSAKLKRLKSLMEIVKVTLSIDNRVAGEGISDLGVALRRKIPVYIEVDTGLKRIGRMPGRDVLEFGRELALLPGIEIRGIMSHGGQCYGSTNQDQLEVMAIEEAQLMVQTKALLESHGIPIQEVSLGASPTTPFLNRMKGVTEIRPGTYIFNDYNQLLLGSAKVEDCAVRIFTTVISRPAQDRIVIDAGSKTLTSDNNVSGKGYGYVVDHQDFYIERLSEEHGILSIPPDSAISIGDTLCIIPNHVCPVINLANELMGRIHGQWQPSIPIEARGKNR